MYYINMEAWLLISQQFQTFCVQQFSLCTGFHANELLGPHPGLLGPVGPQVILQA